SLHRESGHVGARGLYLRDIYGAYGHHVHGAATSSSDSPVTRGKDGSLNPGVVWVHFFEVSVPAAVEGAVFGGEGEPDALSVIVSVLGLSDVLVVEPH